MKWNSILNLFALLLFFTGCGQNVFESNSAPKTSDEVGIIASCTTKEQALSIAKETGTKIRVINEKKKLIEFIGLGLSELAARLPRAKLVANKIYKMKLIETSDHFSAKAIENQQFYGAHTPQYRSINSGRYFPHLEQIDALEENTHLGAGITIAIIDTGVYYNHPHLSPNMKLNPADKNGDDSNHLDDDNNGYEDDYIGWDFYNGDAYPIDDNGHGTHVAGLAASTYMGIAPRAKILPIKVLSADGRGDLGTITAGILYAIDMKVDIINLSLGGTSGGKISQDIQQLINSVKAAKANDILVVSAAGNGGADGIGDCNDSEPIYPANIQEDNMLTVASVNSYNELASYSNFGEHTVHIAAPGGDAQSLGLSSTAIAYCNGPCLESNIPYVAMSGTSMATPIVAGLAAVIKGAKSNLNPKKIKDIIMQSGTKESSLNGLIKSASVVNLAQALKI